MKQSIYFLSFNAFFTIIALFLPSCIHRKQIDKQKLHISPTNITTCQLSPIHHTPPPVTIWVHGTLMFRTPLYHHIFNKKSSLVHVMSLPENHHFRLLASTIKDHDSEHFPLEEFYIFSWSGRLQNKERKDSAEKLSQEIITLISQYKKKYGFKPIIRIISHSHGGNVVLNMAALPNAIDNIIIEALVLLACPVQEETMHLINSPIFCRIYSLYSSLDMIQILAPQFRHIDPITTTTKRKRHYKIPPFSSRIFPPYKHVRQTKIKINHYPISHTNFSTTNFVALLPAILNKLDEWHYQTLTINQYNKYKLLCIYTQQAN